MHISAWNINRVLQAMWKLLNDPPANNDIHKTVNLTYLSHYIPFYKTEWVEDQKVAACGIMICPYIVEVKKHYQI